jgi:16S rRNA (adenine1518-N6/adenine1519-N6)-dimethyltransferase
VIDGIVDLIDPQPLENILEIGPGDAALTAPLVASGCQLTAVEIDRDLAELLQQRFASSPNFMLHCVDILKFDFNALTQTSSAWKIVGNLPYNISTPLILRLLEQDGLWSSLVVMVQREVAERLAAVPGGKEYGRLSIAAQRRCSVRIRLDVGPDSFDPPPKVDSAVVELRPHGQLLDRETENRLDDIVRVAFSARRKTISNALRAYLDADSLRACGIDPSARAAELSVDDYVHLAKATLR